MYKLRFVCVFEAHIVFDFGGNRMYHCILAKYNAEISQKQKENLLPESGIGDGTLRVIRRFQNRRTGRVLTADTVKKFRKGLFHAI